MSTRSERVDDKLSPSPPPKHWLQKFQFLFAVIGQGLFSLTRFATTMVIGGRFKMGNVSTGGGSEAELGQYLAYFSVLLFGMGILEAFITTPMTYLMHGRREEQKPLFSTFLLLVCSAAAVIVCAVVLINGALLKIGYPGLALGAVVAFGVLMATQFVREFLVRWLLAHLKTWQYAVYELAYFVFFAFAIGLIISGQQAYLSTIFAVAAACNVLLIALIWWQHHPEFAPIQTTLQQAGLLNRRAGKVAVDANVGAPVESSLWSDFTSTMREQIYFGRWLALDSIFAVMTVYFFNWLLLLKIDATAAGIYGACMTIVLLANPFLNGVISAFAPIAAMEYQESGKAGLNRILWRYGGPLVVLMLAFAVCLWFVGGPLTKLVYGESYDQFFAVHYAGHNRIPFLLGLAMPLNAAAYVLACNLMACGHPKYICVSSLAGLLAVVGLGGMMGKPDLVSCAWCFAISIGVTLLFRIYFYWTCPKPPKRGKVSVNK